MLKCEGWTLIKEGLPAQNGDYIVAKRVGSVDIMAYTTTGGWNTLSRRTVPFTRTTR